MPKFIDHTGHEWEVVILVGHLKTLRESHGIQTKAKTGEFYKSLADVVGDEEKLYDLLLYLCERQMKERGIGPEEFAFLISGETLREASATTAEAILDFYQGPNTAKEMAAAVRAAMMTGDEKIGNAIRDSMPKLISKLTAGKLPDSSASTRTPELSVN